MTTERIDIIVSERGSRVVKRNLEDIGGSARSAATGLGFLKRALAGLGTAVLLRELQQMADTYTLITNRLRLVTTGAANLAAINDRLFASAQRTRTSYEATVDLYARVARNAGALGLSQERLLSITETVNQAIRVSGGSAQEAAAGVRQFGQALGSGALRGDELISVLENMPRLAQAIADGMGVTIGELRQLGADGELTSQRIVDALEKSAPEIAREFSQLAPTIGEAFTVLSNSALRFIGEMDQALGISQAVANILIVLANNLSLVAAAAGAAAAAWAAFTLAPYIQAAVNAIRSSAQLAAAVRAGNATLLTAVDIERAKAASALATAEAESLATAAKVRDLQVGRAQLTQNLALIQQQRAQALAYVELQTGIAAATGRTAQLTSARQALNASTRALLVTQRALRLSSAELAAAQTAEAGATNALAAARGRQAAADAAASTFVARLTRQFPLLGGVIGTVARAASGLWAILVANPIGAVIAAIVAVVGALFVFRDSIKVTADGVVSLGDVFRAVFSLIGEYIAPVVEFFRGAWEQAVDYVGDKWNSLVDTISTILGAILGFIKTMVNTQIGVWVGAFKTIVGVWNLLPEAFRSLGAAAVNGLLDIVKTGVEGVVKAVGDLLEFIGQAAELVGLDNPFAGLADNFELNLDRFRIEGGRSVGEVFSDIGSVAASSFNEALNTDYIGTFVDTIMARAREIAEARAAMRAANVENDGGPAAPGLPGGAAGSAREVADQVQRMRDLLEEIRGPMVDYQANLQALDSLLAAGAITAEEYADKWRDIRIAFLDTQTTFAAGLERGFLKVQRDLEDMASQIEDVLTNAFKSAEDALVEFIQTGKLDFKGFVNSILEDLIRLSVRQTIIRPLAGFLGNLLGFDGAEALGGGGGAGAAALTGSATALTGSATALTGAATALSSAAAAMGAAGFGGGLGGGLGNQVNQATQAAAGAAQAASTAAGSVQQLPGIFGAFQGGLSGIFGGLQNGLGGLFGGFGQALSGLFGNLLSGLGNIFSSIFGGGGGGGFGGFLTSLIGGIFGGGGLGFATGGGFNVGGGGGVDSQLVAFRASPGERVEVKRPGQDSQDGGQRQQIVFNITTPDAESFRRSESQIAARMARIANRGRRNL